MPYYKEQGSKAWGLFLIIGFIVLSYFFPNFPRQTFRIVVGGIENIIAGGKDVLSEELADDFATPQISPIEFPDVVNTQYGICSQGLMSKYNTQDWLSVGKPGGIRVTSSTGILSAIQAHLEEGTPIRVTGNGICKNGAAWWPIEWRQAGEIKTGWAMGGQMLQGNTYEVFFWAQ